MRRNKQTTTLIIIIFFLGFITTGNIHGQRTYIIEGNSKMYDVLLRKESDLLSHRRCLELKRDTIIVHSPKDIDGFKYKYGKSYRSGTIGTGERVFLELLFEGKLSLLKFQDTSYQSKYYLQLQGSDEVIELPRRSNRYRKVFRDAWLDCKDLKKAVNQTPFNETAFLRLVRAYEDCKYIHIPKVEANVNVGLGMTELKVDATTENPSIIPSGSVKKAIAGRSNPSVVINTDLTFPLFSSNASFLTGIHLLYQNASHEDDFRGESLVNLDITTLDIAIPLGFKYVIDGEKILPFGGISIGPSFALINDATMSKRVRQSNGEFISDEGSGGINRLGLAPDIFLGTHYYINESRKVSFKLGYRSRFNLGDQTIYNYETFYVTLGWQLF